MESRRADIIQGSSLVGTSVFFRPADMNDRITLKHHLIALAFVSAWCLLLAITYATAYYEGAAGSGREVDWFNEFKPYLISNGSWILLTPIMLLLCHWFRFDRGRRMLVSLIHLIAGLLLGSVKSIITYFGFEWLIASKVPMWGISSALFGCVTYLTFLAVYNGILFYRRFRDREVRAHQLEGQLTKAQLEVLRMQLHPHFLFNTLHTISSLNLQDVTAANRMISRLSDLLRLSLDNAGLHEVSLKREIDFLERYLDIEKIRFGDRLNVDVEVPPDVLEACVPNLILQPIVENAVRHGISRMNAQGRITLRAMRKGDELRIEVCDNGPGRKGGRGDWKPRVGLANTKARLEGMYGLKGGLEIISPEEGGCTIRLILPFHKEPEKEFTGKRYGPEQDQDDHRG